MLYQLIELVTTSCLILSCAEVEWSQWTHTGPCVFMNIYNFTSFDHEAEIGKAEARNEYVHPDDPAVVSRPGL